MDATDSFTYEVDDLDKLAGVPQMFVDAAAHKARLNGKENIWEFGLDAPTFMTILNYAKNRDLREVMYRAYVTRASDLGPSAGRFDNSQVLVDILTLKQKIAKILGFKNYAEYSLETKMAANVAEVFDFLQNLGNNSRGQALAEYEELKLFAKQHDDIDLMPWIVLIIAR